MIWIALLRAYDKPRYEQLYSAHFADVLENDQERDSSVSSRMVSF